MPDKLARYEMKVFLGLVATMTVGSAFAQSSLDQDRVESLEGVTYDAVKGKVFVPVRELGSALKVYVGWDADTRTITLDEVDVPDGSVRKLYDGTNMVDVVALKSVGYKVVKHDSGDGYVVSKGLKVAQVLIPEKWVEISIGDQELVAFQGERIVMTTNVSTGRSGFRTPTGEFKAGPEKSRMRYSRTYDNSPMPFAVQLRDGYFIHGYYSVPSYPASHGCIRMPLGKTNAAKYFFEWVDLGTPVAIRKEWSDKVEALLGSENDAEQGSVVKG